MTPIRFSPSSLKEGRWYEYLIRFALLRTTFVASSPEAYMRKSTPARF
jgi:hypothetical protein